MRGAGDHWVFLLHHFTPFYAMKHFLPVALVFCFAASLFAQDGKDKNLPRAATDKQLDSVAVEAFLSGMEAKKMDLHSVMVVQNGKVVCERWFGDNAPGKNHVMWSVSKTWTATAVGFAVSELTIITNSIIQRHSSTTS